MYSRTAFRRRTGKPLEDTSTVLKQIPSSESYQRILMRFVSYEISDSARACCWCASFGNLNTCSLGQSLHGLYRDVLCICPILIINFMPLLKTMMFEKTMGIFILDGCFTVSLRVLYQNWEKTWSAHCTLFHMQPYKCYLCLSPMVGTLCNPLRYLSRFFKELGNSGGVRVWAYMRDRRRNYLLLRGAYWATKRTFFTVV